MLKKNRERSVRKVAGKDIIVRTGTMGTPDAYNLRVENASATGLLLSWKNNYNLPFQENSLLDLCFDPATRYLSDPVSFVGKIVRLTTDTEGKDLFGIKICVLEGEELQSWDEAFSSIQELFPRELPNLR